MPTIHVPSNQSEIQAAFDAAKGGDSVIILIPSDTYTLAKAWDGNCGLLPQGRWSDEPAAHRLRS